MAADPLEEIFLEELAQEGSQDVAGSEESVQLITGSTRVRGPVERTKAVVSN